MAHTGSTAEPTVLERRLGLAPAIALVAGGTIGTSIFIVPSDVAAAVGAPMAAIAVWIVAGLFACLAALCLAELSAAIPKTGGIYAYLRRAYPTDYISFSYAWMISFVYGPGAMAVVASMAASFIAPYVQDVLGLPAPPVRSLALGLIILVAAINLTGAKVGGWTQTALTIAKVLLLAGSIAAAFILLGPRLEHLAPAASAAGGTQLGFSGFTGGLLLALFSYSGAHFVTLVGGEIRNPQRNLPLSIAIGMATVLALYVLFNVAIFSTLPFEQAAASERIGFDLMAAALGPVGGAIAACTVFLSGAAVLNAQCLGYPRVIFSLAQDGQFFRGPSYVHPRTGAPTAAILICTACAIGYLFSGSYREVLGYMAFVSQLFMTLMAVAVIALRRREPTLDRPFRMWGYPYTPLFYIAVSSAYLCSLLITKTSTVLVGIVLVAAGLPFYLYFSGRRGRARSSAHLEGSV